MPDPLHPAIVHFPIVLAMMTPFIAAGTFWSIQTQRLPGRSWLGIVIVQVLVVASIFAATVTGEREEERVERVVSEHHIEEHEEAGERVRLLAILVLPLAGAGMLAGRIGLINRGLTVALSLAVLVAAVLTGKSGGELVYKHGAAAAYTQSVSGDAVSAPGTAPERHHDDDDDDD